MPNSAAGNVEWISSDEEGSQVDVVVGKLMIIFPEKGENSREKIQNVRCSQKINKVKQSKQL